MPINLCQHSKQDGNTCASPALAGQTLCYFHSRDRAPQQHTDATLELPELTDRAAILTALSQLLQSVALNQIDTKRANLLLRGLSLATRLAASIEKQQSSQTDTPAPISQGQTIAAAEATTPTQNTRPAPPSRPTHHISGYHSLTRRQRLAARRARTDKNNPCHSERSEESPHFVQSATTYTLGIVNPTPLQKI